MEKYVSCKEYKFHSHNAKEKIFELENGGRQIEFWSYSTPMIIRVGGKMYMNENGYSNSTRRQVNRYMGEEGLRASNAIFMTEDEMRSLCLW